MQKEIVIVIIILVLIITLNVITQNYTDKSVDTINAKLQEISDTSEAKLKDDSSTDSTYINESIEKLNDEWNNINKKLAFYIEHDELEKVDTSIVVAKQHLYLENYDEAVPELKKCIFILEHIKDKQTIKVINLF